MRMKVKIQRSQIHKYKVTIYDDNGQPTGETKDVLQLDIQFPEYPDLPTYGLRIDAPITKQKVKDVIIAKAQEAKAQMEMDEQIRELLGTEILQFEVDV